ncbi:hypothetical protein VaNZ11_006454, partial [Volvox africanus]
GGSHPPPPRKRSLLEKLLHQELRQERSWLLQAIRFLVRNDFLQALQPTSTVSSTDKTAAECLDTPGVGVDGLQQQLQPPWQLWFPPGMPENPPDLKEALRLQLAAVAAEAAAADAEVEAEGQGFGDSGVAGNAAATNGAAAVAPVWAGGEFVEGEEGWEADVWEEEGEGDVDMHDEEGK